MAREYFREINGKKVPVYHVTNLVKYFTCPASFTLSTKVELEQTEAQRTGKLLEGYVLGFRSEEEKKSLIGRKKEDTLKELQSVAGILQPYFQGGEAFVPMEYYFEKEGFIILGELDYFIRDKRILDLKFTGDIERIWNSKTSQLDFLQSGFYSWLVYLNTGTVLPFKYIVSEQSGLHKKFDVEISETDYEGLFDLVCMVHDDQFKFASPSITTCLQGKFGRCKYLEYCTEGKEFIASDSTITFADLID